MLNLMKAFRRTAAAALCLALVTVVCGCQESTGQTSEDITSVNSSGTSGNSSGSSSGSSSDSSSGNSSGSSPRNEGDPYVVKTILREYASVNPDTGTGVYGRYTELVVEGDAPDTLREAVTECNRRAEESIRTRAEQAEHTAKALSDTGSDGYRYVTLGYIAAVTRADQTAISILETEFEKGIGQHESEMTYHFRGVSYDTESGEEITLADLIDPAGEGTPESVCSEVLGKALSAKYGVNDLAKTSPSDYAWTVDALGIRFYFHSDAVSKAKRNEIGDYSARAITAAIPYADLPGRASNGKANILAEAPDSYIAMIDRETVYDLPHGDRSVILTEKDGSLVIRMLKDNGETTDLSIEYADDLSDFYIIRAAGGFYLFRERVSYQEGFFYDFAKPDGGFGRFAYNISQYFDSFLREIELALPYNPNCVHMAEVRRSFGEKSYDKSSFVPHGHYTFPSDPDARYKKFVLTDGSLQIDTYNVVCRLLEDLPAAALDESGAEIGEITVPAGKSLIFETVTGEAPRYDTPPQRNQARTFFYTCRLTDGSLIGFESTTESTVSVAGGYMNRFTEPITLGEAQFEDAPEPAEVFTVRIGGKDYPLIPDYSSHTHTGEEIDFGDDIWWQVEGYPGRYVCTQEDLEEMKDAYFTQDALSRSEKGAELVISEDGQVEFDYFGEKFTGTLPEKRYYRTDAMISMESEVENRTFQFILREGEEHSQPVRIALYSEGLPATNEPSTVPPLAVFLTRVE